MALHKFRIIIIIIIASIAASDLTPHVSQFCHSEWQQIWDVYCSTSEMTYIVSGGALLFYNKQ